MEIILIQDVPQLGYRGDIMNVRPGYARNFLIPNGMATTATESNRKINSENLRQAAHKIGKIKADAEALAQRLNELNLRFEAKTGISGRIFGSITTLQIAHALKDKGFDIDRRKISVHGDIKELGNYEVNVDLHRDIKAKFNIEVVAEAAPAE